MQIPLTQNISELFAEAEHEEIALWEDQSCGYRGLIAIHSTALGPAVGGTRFWNYPSDEAATVDVLRLSKGMSYKNALAGLPFGGGKAVIIGDSRTSDRERIFRAHGKFVESLGGRFITAEDIGTTPSDMEIVNRETDHVGGLPERSGNPSPKTALGVFRAMQACAQQRWGTDSLRERTVALQGCGSTGYYLAQLLHQAGARLVVCDVDQERVRRVVNEFGAVPVAAAQIFDVAAEVFAPCALGGVINDETIAKLRVEIIAGSANNQLLTEAHGEALAEKGVLYAPDYVVNSGGIINGCRELLGWDEVVTTEQISGIYDRLLALFALAEREGVPPFRAADQLAREMIRTAEVTRVETLRR
jgi:leucine dehydrogenase